MNQLNRDSTEYARALLKAQLRLTNRARADMSAFYEYVMREETTRARLRALPFQKLVFDFVGCHPMCVVRLPVGGSKTYMMAALTMKLLGEDPTARGAIISATQPQAAKPLNMVRNYVEQSAELRAVYPKLCPSTREGDPWTQTAITVDRPYGIRDPSLVAVGIDGSIPGARLNWCLVDDILNLDNTGTPDRRKHTLEWIASTVFARLDVTKSRMVVTNTPWVGPTSSDPGDLTYYLEAKGWPTLTITIWGDVYITNAPNFDTDLIRPGEGCETNEGKHRLVAHDDPVLIRSTYEASDLGPIKNPNVDVDEVVPFWPQKYSRPAIEQIKELTTASNFARNYEMRARGESEDRVNEAWILTAKNEARRLGHTSFVPNTETLRQIILRSRGVEEIRSPLIYDTESAVPGLLIATGVDLAIGKKQSNARTVLYTAAALPKTRQRVILDIEAGHWSGSEIIAKIIAKHDAYGSIVRVENNAAQDFLLQWARECDRSLPVRAHTTGKNKADPVHGVESLFIELEQNGWLIPCDDAGKSPPEVEAWLQDIRQYSPETHTGDYLMASWLCDWQLKKLGATMRELKPAAVGSIMYR